MSKKFTLLSASAFRTLLGATAAPDAVVIEGNVVPKDPAEGDPDPATPPAGDPPSPPAPPADPETPGNTDGPSEEGPEANAQVITLAEAASTTTALVAEARTAERKRTAAVFASAEALANPGMAAWMLSNSPDANADAIVAQLKTMPSGSKPGANTQVIPDTNVDLGRGDPNAAIDSPADEGKDPWAASHARVFGKTEAATPSQSVATGGSYNQPGGGYRRSGN